MRSLTLLLVAGLLAPSHLSAQEPQGESGKLGFAVGLTHSESANGLTGRVTYAPLGVERPLTVRLEAGFRWTPTYHFLAGAGPIGRNGIGGEEWNLIADEARGADIAVGATAVLSPMPKSRFAPYLIGGVLSVQEWYRTRSGFSPSAESGQEMSWQRQSAGGLHLVGGVGLRARILGHSFQLEARRYNYTTALTVGSNLRF